MYSGMNYNQLKKELMKLYGVTSTQLDRGEKVPHCIYCIKSFFRYEEKWVPQDFVKIGKSFSVSNRARIYSQTGADIKTLWTIELAYPGLASEIETLVHNYGEKYHAGLESAHCTEMFNLDINQAFIFLNNFIQKYDILNDNRVTKIHMFDKNIITINSNVKPREMYKYDTHFDNIFNIV